MQPSSARGPALSGDRDDPGPAREELDDCPSPGPWLAVTARGVYELGVKELSKVALSKALRRAPDWPVKPAAKAQCKEDMPDTSGEGEGVHKPGRPGTAAINGRPAICRCSHHEANGSSLSEERLDATLGFVRLSLDAWGDASPSGERVNCTLTLKP